MSLFVISDSDGRIGRTQAGYDVYFGRPGMPSLDSVLLGRPESRIGKCLLLLCAGEWAQAPDRTAHLAGLGWAWDWYLA